jgi:hypothetical protein
MKKLIAILALCAPVAPMAAESTAERVKTDAKAVAHGVKEAAVDVGKQIGAGSKKAYKSAKTKIKSDVRTGRPGDGSHAARNERLQNAKEGRE